MYMLKILLHVLIGPIQSVFQISDRSNQYFRRFDILKSYAIEITLRFIVSFFGFFSPLKI